MPRGRRAKYALGIDLGGTGIKAGVVSADGLLLKEWKIPTEAKKGGGHVVERMVDLSKKMLAGLPEGVSEDEILGIGIGSPGVFDYNTGALVAGAVNIPGLNGTPMRSIFETKVGLPTRVDNDANAFALAEACYGAGRGNAVAAAYTIGTGIGGGVVIDGKVFRGAWGFAGELGHVTVEPEGIYCPCGNHGCMESYASANAIATYASQQVEIEKGSILSSLPPEEITCKSVGEAAAKGDSLALRVVERAAYYLGAGIAAVVITLNPAVVIIGGGGALMGDLLFNPLRENLNRRVYHQRVRQVTVVGARLGTEAGIVGAAGLAFSEIKERSFTA
jgi:glucokinase